MKIIIISAVAQNGVIGRSNGDMPWHVKEEFKHFKQTTIGFPILMGRKTFETLGKPLKGRENIVITRDENFSCDFEEVKIVYSLKEGMEHCKIANPEKVILDFLYIHKLNTVEEMRFNKILIKELINFDRINQYQRVFNSKILDKRVEMFKNVINA